MRKVPILLLVLLMAAPACALAQTSLSDQIESVYSIQQQRERAEQAALAAQQAEMRRERQQHAAAARAQAAVARARIDAAAAIARDRIDAAAAIERAKMAEAEADKKRDQSYEDQLRSLTVEEKKLELEAIKTRVGRENDYIDQELRQRAADTDVTKSQADATRNISSGVKSFLDQTGAAEIRSSSVHGRTAVDAPQ